ncbi:MAG TPA: hypothetical protein VIV11_34555 [Kofleriaceae bacterium]
MTSYVHFRRYGKKPGSAEVATIDIVGDGQVVYRGHRYDLRTGEKGIIKQPGFSLHVDGRFLQWNQSDSFLEVHHADGKVITVHIVGGKPIGFVGKYLVYSDDARQPWIVYDTNNGELVGRIEDQRGDATHGTVLYSPQWFDPKNDRTLWLCEGSRLAELDVAKRRMARTIEADPEHVFIGVAALTDGHVITLARTLEDKAKHKRSGDRIVLFSPTGDRLRDIAGEVMGLHRLGEHFIVSDDRKEQFVIYDRSLEPVANVEMFEPGKDAYNSIVPFPNGREWLGVGGRGEWDHYGEPELAPASKAKKVAVKKEAAKKAKKPSAE